MSTPATRAALDAVAPALRCPVCAGAPLRRDEDGRALVCPARHSFDVARQGYVSLVTGSRRPAGDDAAMVAARERFLGRDHYRPLRDAVAALVDEHAPSDPSLVVDLAGGTGHYTGAVLDARTAATGLVVDVSTAALRRAARAHPRAAAATADVRRPLPLRTGVAGAVLSVFGPRDVAEVTRVLAPAGVWVLAHASPEHLAELREPLGTLTVDPDKDARLADALRPFVTVERRSLAWPLALDHADVTALAAMGPSAHHREPDDLARRAERLSPPVDVTAAVTVSVLRPR